MVDNQNFRIRPMMEDDLHQAIGLSGSEGWNQTEREWRILLENRENRCIVAELNNKIAGTATAMIHSGKVAWIGMVLVEKTMRGRGVGKMMLSYLLDNLSHVESVKLDATPAGLPIYLKLGFIEEYRIFRMTNGSLNYIPLDKNLTGKPERISNEILTEIINLDKGYFGADRSYLLRKLFANFNNKAFYSGTALNPDGYIFGRDGAKFSYLGPLYAFSTGSAIRLIDKAMETLSGQPVAIDIPEDKPELIKWFESAGFVKQRYFVRMFLGNNPCPGVVKNQCLISGPEFG